MGTPCAIRSKTPSRSRWRAAMGPFTATCGRRAILRCIPLAEFTGERVIPGLVDVDLLNEHLARYLFAKHFIARMPQPASVLDAGCGSGYGSAELSKTGALVTGADVSGEAVAY